MQFTVPQFLEGETKIIGPLTFKQFIFIGTAGGACLILYFVLSMAVFVFVSIILLGGASALAFLKIKKTPLPVFIKNFFIFILGSRIYLWRKRTAPPKTMIKLEKPIEAKKKEVPEKQKVLKVGKGSRLKELFTRIETKK